MNTVRSVGYGWAVLIAAGGGAYYFAKQNVNADREAKHRASLERRALNQRYTEMEMAQKMGSPNPASAVNSGAIATTSGHAASTPSGGSNGNAADNNNNPSMEASADPAPTRHAPTTVGEKVEEKSKYEASEVWRSKKGDRLR